MVSFTNRKFVVSFLRFPIIQGNVPVSKVKTSVTIVCVCVCSGNYFSSLYARIAFFLINGLCCYLVNTYNVFHNELLH
jgi:hypothetical protein